MNCEVVLQLWAPKDCHCDPAFRGIAISVILSYTKPKSVIARSETTKQSPKASGIATA
jgi:hypothetical protein